MAWLKYTAAARRRTLRAILSVSFKKLDTILFGTKLASVTPRTDQSLALSEEQEFPLMKTPTPSQLRCWLTLLLAATAAVATSAQTPTPGPNGKITFSSNRDGHYEIYVMDADGSNQTRLTNNSAEDAVPAWSPDGTKIAFASTRDGNYEIYLMDEDGSNPIRLTNNPALDLFPDWSPDGAKLAFTSLRDANYEVYVMDVDGSNQANLTNHSTPDSVPDWSPDGTKIAFRSFRDGNGEIYVMDANGSSPINLTNNPAEDTGPAWSPDGTRLAFVSNRDGNIEVYVMDANGSNPIRLTNNPAEDTDPAWSPDGSKIVFTSLRDGNYEVYVMDASGSNQTNLTNAPQTDSSPDWQRISDFVTPTPVPTVTPTASPTATPTATPPVTSPTSTPVITPTPTPGFTPSPTPVTTPTATPSQALNLSTRMRVQTGENVGIGGFIITGSAPKHILLRAIGPSLAQLGVPDVLADPVLELYGVGGFVTITNNNWREDPVQETAIIATGIPPSNNLEAAIDIALNPGSYTAIVKGNNNTLGVALVEVYDLSQAVPSMLANISTRAFVDTGSNIVIAGFILGGNSGNDRLVMRGIGPSLTVLGVTNALANPTLQLRDNNGALLIGNNDWQDDPAQASELIAAGLAPTNPLESGIAATLPPGLYTALLAGFSNGTGVGVVEIYDRGGP